MSVLLALLVLGSVTDAPALEAPPPSPRTHLLLRLPLVDAPFNVRGFPSMAQSLAVTEDLSLAIHQGIDTALRPLGWPWHRMASLSAIFGFDLVFTYLPGGPSWLHEEWHRATLTRRGLSSYDDVYRFKLFTETISVSHLEDGELARFKRDHPAEHVRMSAAGFESEWALLHALRDDGFYEGTALEPQLPSMWLVAVNNLFYLNMCTGSEADTLTDQLNAAEPTIPVRDFTGLDCTAWAYDLHRPDEPYAARGAHPSGVGYDRYIKRSDLSPAEQRYLATQARLSLVNLVSPALAGFERLPGPRLGGARAYWNASLSHYLTSYGDRLGLDVLLDVAGHGLFVGYRHHQNGVTSSPGLELALVREPVLRGRWPVALSGRLELWLQPRGQLFFERHRQPGGALTLGADVDLGEHLGLYAEGLAKSAGWMPGVVDLERAVELRSGVFVRF